MGGGGMAAGAANRAFLSFVYPYAATTNPPDAGFVVSLHNAIGASVVGVTSYAVCRT
jgi:hypothetical protein